MPVETTQIEKTSQQFTNPDTGDVYVVHYPYGYDQQLAYNGNLAREFKRYAYREACEEAKASGKIPPLWIGFSGPKADAATLKAFRAEVEAEIADEWQESYKEWEAIEKGPNPTNDPPPSLPKPMTDRQIANIWRASLYDAWVNSDESTLECTRANIDIIFTPVGNAPKASTALGTSDSTWIKEGFRYFLQGPAKSADSPTNSEPTTTASNEDQQHPPTTAVPV